MLAGAAAEDFGAVSGQVPSHPVTLTAQSFEASQLLAAVNQAAASYEPGFSHLPLDYTGLPGCSDACTEEALKVSRQRIA